MIQEKQLDKLLKRVEKPARYIGGELYSADKDPAAADTRFAFAFPDTYEIGMSYLGLQIIYHLLNKMDSVFCERVFAPAMDMEALMREEQIPLFTLETKTPLREMDIVGFTLQYELSYTNVVNMLDLAGIPLYAEERGEEDPFVIAGGPCAFNPEPLAPLLDFVLLGDGEEILKEICLAHREWKKSGLPKRAFLEKICTIPGVYVPVFYEPVYDADGRFLRMDKLFEAAPARIEKRIVSDLSAAEFPEKPLVPLLETVHDRAVVEIFRGCTRGCRFCQAGMLYRPVRERPREQIESLARAQIAATGHDEMSLLSLSTSDYSEIEPLVENLMDLCRRENVALSLPSLRLDSFSFEVLSAIQGYKKSGLTFAPEAGSQRLRDVINKNITEQDIFSAIEQAVSLGWNSIKLYFMVGLPTETDEDLDGIVSVAEKIMDIAARVNGGRRGRFHITVSVSNFVPKPHTPFQWCPQDTEEEFCRKHDYLREKLRRVKGVTFRYHETHTSHMEAVFSRGDRRVCKALLKAWELGCKFDGWAEHFRYETWLEAFRSSGVDDGYYTYFEGKPEMPLPWDHLDCSVSKDFLRSEWEKAQQEQCTADCRHGCAGCGINSRVKCEREGTL